MENSFKELNERIKQNWEKHGTLEWAILGLNSEAGEVADILIKEKYFDQDPSGLVDELGDCLHYLLAICHLTGISWESVIEANLQKSKDRYPDGWNKNPIKLR